MYFFCYFIIISPWKRAGPFIWINLNPLHPKMSCAKFDWNWPSGSGVVDENVKSLQQRWRTTVKFLLEKLTWAFDSGELKMGNRQYNMQVCQISMTKLGILSILHTIEIQCFNIIYLKQKCTNIENNYISYMYMHLFELMILNLFEQWPTTLW